MLILFLSPQNLIKCCPFNLTWNDVFNRLKIKEYIEEKKNLAGVFFVEILKNNVDMILVFLFNFIK